MAASLPGLREIAKARGLKVHHLGAGYPHPEVTDPRGFLQHQSDYFDYVKEQERHNDPNVLPEYLRELLLYRHPGPPKRPRDIRPCVREGLESDDRSAKAYTNRWGIWGYKSTPCSLFERSGEPVAYITDAPTYAGFTARASLCQHATIFSVEMDAEGAIPERMRAQN